MENIPVQFTVPPPSYAMAPPPPLPTMAPPPLPMAPPPPPPPMSSYQQQTQQMSKQMSVPMSGATNPTWVTPVNDWRGPMPRPVRAFNSRQPWRGAQRFKNHSRFSPYNRQQAPYNNNFQQKKQQQGVFAVPFPPRRMKVANKTPGRPAPSKPASEAEGENSVKKKGKKRSMSEKYPTKPWNREDAEKALAIENKFRNLNSNNAVMIRFPDPELSKEIVRSYHPGIKSVHFQAPSGQRYCFVQLREGANVDEAIEDLNLVEFGNGRLIAERKTTMKEDDAVVTPECIDPYTLYVGNLPVSITASRIREQFPNSSRVDIGFAQKMKFTRWAFIRFENVDLAIEAFKSAINLEFDSRSVVLRFRRATAKQLGICDQSKNVKTENIVEKQSSSGSNSLKEAAKDSQIKKEPKLESTEEDDEEDYEQDIENELDSVMGDVDTYTELGDDELDYMYNIGNEVDDDDDDEDEVVAYSTSCNMNKRFNIDNEDDDDDDDEEVERLPFRSNLHDNSDDDEPFLRNRSFL